MLCTYLRFDYSGLQLPITNGLAGAAGGALPAEPASSRKPRGIEAQWAPTSAGTGAAGVTLHARRILSEKTRVPELPASRARLGGGSGGRGHAGNGREQVAPAIGIWVAACFPGGAV